MAITPIKAVPTGTLLRAFSSCRHGLAVLVLMLFAQTAHALPDLSLGPFGPGVQDGTDPFNVDGGCATETDTAIPGDDCGESNGQVRTSDSVIFNWSITANNFTPGQDAPQNVVLEQILKPEPNAELSFKRIPARCTPAGGGGTNPTSSIITEPNGDIKLTCNLGELQEGQQISFSVFAIVSAESHNGSTFTSTQRLYSNADDGTPNANETTAFDLGPYTISARPEVDLSTTGFRGYYAYGSKDVGQGLEPGYWTWFTMLVSTDMRYGSESVQQPLDFLFDLTATKNAVDGDDYTNSGLEYYMDLCSWARWFSNEPYGVEPATSSYLYDSSVINSGTCTYDRTNPTNPADPYNISINNADLSGNRFPTQLRNGVDLSAGPYHYIAMTGRFFIPFRVIDNADGALDNTGSMYITSTLKNFDPVGVSGTPNFGGAKEPGYNGAVMPDGSISNNVIPPYNYYITTRGGFSHAHAKTANNRDVTAWHDPYSWHGGGGLLASGDAFPVRTIMHNTGAVPFTDPHACNVFDNTTLKLTDRGETGGTAGTFAYVGERSELGFDHNNYVVEYGNVDLTGDDPLDKDGDGNTDYNNQTGRYEGNWSTQSAYNCDDAVTTWYTDPNAVPGGIDNINIVRARLADSSSVSTLDNTQYLMLYTPLEVRQTFNGGPHAGDIIPMGTVLASFGRVRSDEWHSSWTGRSYVPAPENGSGDGDRVTLARSTVQLDSETLTPAAGPGQNGSTIAGNPIVWKINTAIQSITDTPATEDNVRIIAELPPRS